MENNKHTYILNRLSSRFFLISLSFLLISAFVWWVTHAIDNEKRSDILRQARIIHNSINTSRLKSLSSVKEIEGSQDYLRLQTQLSTVCSANPQCIGLYLVGKSSEDADYFHIGSESSRTGVSGINDKPYQNTAIDLNQIFNEKRERIFGPYSDQKGSRISVLLPFIDNQSDKTYFIFWMDIDGHDWQWNVYGRAAISAGLLLIVISAVFTSFASAFRSSAAPKPIFRRLFPSLAIIIAMLIAGEGAILLHQHQRFIQTTIANNISDIAEHLRIATEQQAAGLAMTIQTIAIDPAVQKDLDNQDTQHLLSVWKPIFDRLNRENHLSHFYFFSENRVCLLRVHKPEHRLDRIDRFTLLEAERTQKISWGIEFGRLGTFTLRVVQPIFLQDKLVGYIELGKELDEIIRALKKPAGYQLAVVLRKEFVDRAAWEQGRIMLGQDTNWDRLAKSIISYSSFDYLPDPIAKYADTLASAHVHGDTSFFIKVNGIDYQIAAMPLQDVTGQAVGDLLIMHDISAEQGELSQLLLLSGIIALILLSSLLFSVFWLIKRIDTSVQSQQTALLESEQSYRNQFMNNSVPMLLIDQVTGSFIDVNHAAVNFYGYPREVFLSKRIADITVAPIFFLPSFADASYQHYSCAEFQHLLADGHQCWVEVSSSSIQSAKQQLLHLIIQDISERKKAERALQENRKQLADIIEFLPDATLAVDLQGRVVIWNKAIENMTGIRADKIVHRGDYAYAIPFYGTARRMLLDYILSQSLIPPENYPTIIREGDTLISEVFCAALNQNEGAWIFAKASPLYDQAGNLIGAIESIRDISSYKHAKENSRQLEAQLQQAQKMKAIGQLAGGIAHDFNNMLGVILGHAEMAMKQLEPSSSTYSGIEKIHFAAERSAHLIKQLLTFSRQQIIHPRVMYVNQSLERMVGMLQRLIGEKIQLLWHPGSDVWPIKADQSQVDQILVNLCVNARDAIKDTGNIIVETSNCHIFEPGNLTLMECPPGDYVRIRISDTGCGMDKHTIAHLFEPFFTTKETGNSTGLGLATVYGSIKQNNGCINVHSEPGKGSTFNLYFPRFTNESEDNIVPAQTEISAERVPGTILVVEDEELVLDVIVEMLERLGFSVLRATGPQEALMLEKHHSGEINLLLSDSIMPEMNGPKLADQLRIRRPEMQCLFMSGYSANVFEAEDFFSNGLLFIQKPFSQTELANKIYEILRNKHLDPSTKRGTQGDTFHS